MSRTIIIIRKQIKDREYKAILPILILFLAIYYINDIIIVNNGAVHIFITKEMERLFIMQKMNEYLTIFEERLGCIALVFSILVFPIMMIASIFGVMTGDAANHLYLASFMLTSAGFYLKRYNAKSSLIMITFVTNCVCYICIMAFYILFKVFLLGESIFSHIIGSMTVALYILQLVVFSKKNKG